MKRFSILLMLASMCAGMSSAEASTQKKHNEKQIEKHAVSHDKLLERLMKYISVESWSMYDDDNGEWSVTQGQKEMAQLLAADAEALGAEAYVSAECYVYVTVPSNLKYDVPSMGISCHLDYTNEAPYQGIKPSVTKYEGGDVVLGSGKVLSPDSLQGRDLKHLVGKTLIHTDGSTLLGGDCKNGCAAAMSVLETLMKSDMRHGEVQFVWCPNEDIGRAAERIDTSRFNPDLYYDLDGEGSSEVGISNFTAREFYVKFIGKDAHPGDAKAMGFGDALAAVSEFIAAIPIDCRPEHSEGTQGYMQAYSLKQTGIDWFVRLRLRYFDKADGEKYDAILKQALEDVRRDHPNVGVEVHTDMIVYENVAYSMHPECVNVLTAAAAGIGKELDLRANRGGTTASMMAARGLNGGLPVFSGQHAIHSVYEYSVLEEVHEAYMLMLHTINQVSCLK
jgi:tripeptide aminopeptidase